MKQIIAFIILALISIGCSKEENSDISEECLEFRGIELLNREKTELITIATFRDGSYVPFTKTDLKTGKKTKHSVSAIPDIEVDFGYGYKEIEKYSTMDVIFMDNGYAFSFIVGYLKENQEYRGYVIRTYNKDFQLISEKVHPPQIFKNGLKFRYYEWVNNNIIEIESTDSSNPLASNLKILNSHLSEEWTMNDCNIFISDNSYHLIDMYNCITHTDEYVTRHNLKTGEIWRIFFKELIIDEVDHKPVELKINNTNADINIVTIVIDATYYDGRKETITLKINTQTGKV